jgi:agmatinase
VKTTALFFPFNLFGSGGTKAGVELLADAFEEMLADNKRERLPTRARAYANKVRFQEFTFESLADYQDWRHQARLAIREVLEREDFLLWTTGNHLGVLPLYDELAQEPEDTLVLQFDAHLDIYNLSDCTSELSHGNFLLHCKGHLPPIINIGHRELLLKPEYIGNYFAQTYSAAQLAIQPEEALAQVRVAAQGRPILNPLASVPTFSCVSWIVPGLGTSRGLPYPNLTPPRTKAIKASVPCSGLWNTSFCAAMKNPHEFLLLIFCK